MTSITARKARRAIALVMAAGVLAVPAVPALAQDSGEARIRKLEAEVRALQRRVFPGGDQRFFEPEISSGAAGAGAAAPAPASTTAVTDILTRLDALEAQLARLTGQVEQNTNRIAQLEARGPAVAPGVTSPVGEAAVATGEVPETNVPSAAQSNLNTMSGGASAAPTPAAAAAAATPAPDAARLAAVRAIEKPQSDDAADDEYSYGFRLWDAGYQPEAQQQLKLFLERYPNHWRASWGRNLLGRSYLDSNEPREAAKWFLQNYQADKAGGRAPDSLLYLAVAMKQADDTKRACIALAEFSETYASEAAGRLNGLYERTRSELTC